MGKAYSFILITSILFLTACKGFHREDIQSQLAISNDLLSQSDTLGSGLKDDADQSLSDLAGDDLLTPIEDPISSIDDPVAQTDDPPTPPIPDIDDPYPVVPPPDVDDPFPQPQVLNCEDDQMLFQEQCLDEFTIHMSADGSDSKDGLSPTNAIQSLNRAQDILFEHDPSVPVVVLIQPGTYNGQKVNWTYYREGQDISFKAADRKNRPLFDGCPNVSNCGGTWFTSKVAPGAETRITFWYLHIKNYQFAIYINSNRLRPDKYSGGNTIYGCRFERIGDIANPSLINPSTGAIVLVNSIRNTIANNHFIDIVNTTKGRKIHAVYLAHQSSENRVERNRFINSSGDVVRIRDYSNYNTVRSNYYQGTTSYAASFLYCDQTTRSDCTKTTPECPSFGNVLGDNHTEGDRSFNTYYFYSPSYIHLCDPIPNGEQRVVIE